ncbi:MAG TPA: N-acetylmuramoyl-L-alanine amidase [Sulfuricurvum sp.]|nr:N-acetylmuramoyl-L-alanine amidase [Sulfuricurvum sp.]
MQKAQKALQSSDEIEQFRGYNEHKSIYLKALNSKDSLMAKEALEGIVKGGELLHIDVTKYKVDLAKLSPSNTVKPSLAPIASLTPPEVKSSERIEKPLEFPKKYLKPALPIIKDSMSNLLTPSSLQPVKSSESLKSSSEGVILKNHRLLESKLKDTGIELIFDTPIGSKEVHLSKIIESEKQRFRYILDIDGAAISQTKLLEHSSIQKIRIAQYDAKTLRMVIESDHAIAIKPVVDGTSLYVDLSLKSAPKPQASSLISVPSIQEPPLSVSPPPLLYAPPQDRSKKVIVIDPGHGGKDSGAVGNGYMEKEIVLQTSHELAERLRSMGYVVHMTRVNDTFVELKDRTKFANDKMADLFLSVHANAIPKGSDANAAYGIETYYLSPGRSERAMRVAALENSEDMSEMGAYGKLSFLNVLNSEKIIASNKLAIDIQKGVLNNLRKQYPNVKDNGAREAPFWVLVGAQMPAILFEMGYISNPEESSRIADSKYQKWMVEGMIDGVKHYFANNL